MTYNEAFSKFFDSYGFRDFMPKYRSLLIAAPSQLTEEAFIRAVTTDCDDKSVAIEAHAEEISLLMKKYFSTFHAIVRATELELDEPTSLVILQSLHESMFCILHHLDQNCRSLSDLQIDYDVHDGPEEYFAYIQKKYGLSEPEFCHLTQGWIDNSEAVYDGLLSREFKLRVYMVNRDQAVFRVNNANSDPVLDVPSHLYCGNRLILSQLFFVSRIIDIFCHLDLITKFLELERTGVVESGDDNFVEIEAIGSFNKIAVELFDKDIQNTL